MVSLPPWVLAVRWAAWVAWAPQCWQMWPSRSSTWALRVRHARVLPSRRPWAQVGQRPRFGVVVGWAQVRQRTGMAKELHHPLSPSSAVRPSVSPCPVQALRWARDTRRIALVLAGLLYAGCTQGTSSRLRARP